MRLNNLSEDIHIRDYFSILWRRKWIVVGFFLITVTLVTLATFSQKKVYRAAATVIVDVESPEVLSVKDVVSLGEPNYFAYKDYLETQKEIIKSRRTAYQVIKNLKLASRQEFKEAKDPIDALLDKLTVGLVRDTRIIKIEAEDGDPKLAASIANEFAKVYAAHNLSLKMRLSSQAQDWLTKEVEKQKKKLNTSELNLQAYKENSSIVSIENQQIIINDTLAKLNTSYIDAEGKCIRAETAYKTVLGEKGEIKLENLPALLTDNKTLQSLKDDYLKQEALLVDYKKIYKYKHPKMIALLENIDYFKSRIKNEIEAEYKSAQEEEQKFKKSLEEQKKRALELERKVIEYNALKREVETNERILQIVLNRLKETSIAGKIQTNNVRVQDLANVPKKPIRPKKVLNIALSMVLALIGGVLLAFFKEYMDVTLKDPRDIASLLQLPVLGTVPNIKVNGLRLKTKQDVDRIVDHDPHSLASEAYRSIRTNLLFSLNHSSSSKSIVITSSVPREGKTITAVNLAAMIANGGEAVLLVDADMRKPRIHSVFAEANTRGLSDFLSGEAGLEEILKYSGKDNLYVITAGKLTDKPAELISSKNMKLFLEKAGLRFSKIIFDTPPINLVTDAALLSSVCSGIVLIVEGGKITKPLLNNTKELFQKVNANILGVIINNIPLTKDNYLYSQHYYGEYYKNV